MLKEHGKITAGVIWYSIVAQIIILLLSFGTMYFYPHLLGLERKAFKASHQYKESKQTAIITLVEKYNSVSAEIAKYTALEEVEIVKSLHLQRKSIKARIRKDVNLLPMEEVPQSALLIIQ